MSSYTRQQLESWLKTITVKGKVLDVGGSQNPVIKRLDKNKIFIDEYKILDLEQPHECKQKPDIIGDLNKQYWYKDDPQQFDVAFCLEVSEYWYNPLQALTNIANFLKPNAVLYVSFHFIYPVHNPPENDYLRYTPAGIEKLLKETGFEIIEMKPRVLEHNELWRELYLSEGMRPAKEYDKHSWCGCLVHARKI